VDDGVFVLGGASSVRGKDADAAVGNEVESGWVVLAPNAAEVIELQVTMACDHGTDEESV